MERKSFRVKKCVDDLKFAGKRGTAELNGWLVAVNATDNENVSYVFFDTPLDKDVGKRKPTPGFVYTRCLQNLKYDESTTQSESNVACKDVEQNLDTTIFPQDHRNSNPGLHLLYTKWAIPHLVEIDKAIKTFSDFSNLNMLGVVQALFTEREKLVTENAAYAEADEILQGIRKRGGVSGENEE